MAEFCVKRQDQVNPDPEKDSLCYKRGDVVTIQEDGWKWTEAEQSGDLCVVKIPGVLVSDLTGFLEPEPGDRLTNKFLQRRAFKFDLDKHDGKPLDLGKALALQVVKPSKTDPDKL